MKLHSALLNENLGSHEGVENRFEDIPGVLLEFHKPPVIVNVGEAETLKLGDEVKVTFRKEKAFAGIGILAQIDNHVVDKDAWVHGPAAPVGESLAVLCHSQSFGDDFTQLAVASHVQEVVSPGILDVTAQKCDFVADFYDAAFPGKGLNKARPLDVIKIDCLFPGPYSLLVNFTAMADKAVAHGISEVERPLDSVGVVKGFDKVCKKK